MTKAINLLSGTKVSINGMKRVLMVLEPLSKDDKMIYSECFKDLLNRLRKGDYNYCSYHKGDIISTHVITEDMKSHEVTLLMTDSVIIPLPIF